MILLRHESLTAGTGRYTKLEAWNYARDSCWHLALCRALAVQHTGQNDPKHEMVFLNTPKNFEKK